MYFTTISRDETYSIDAMENRTSAAITTEGTNANTYAYYPGCDRLMTDGKLAYQYDRNGNLVVSDYFAPFRSNLFQADYEPGGET